jgi:hypothetical protein
MPTQEPVEIKAPEPVEIKAPEPVEIKAPAVSIVLIETNGTVKTLKTKEMSLDTLYKKCGFRVNDDFLCRHTWTVTLKGSPEPYIVSLWGKKTGKANFENKYDLPPPLDKELFFGTCAIVRMGGGPVAASQAQTPPSQAQTSPSHQTLPSQAQTPPFAGSASDGGVWACEAATGPPLDITKETWLKIYEHLFGGFEDIGEDDEYSEDELANVDPALLTAHGYLKDDFVVSDKEVSEEEPPTKIKLKKTAPKKGKAKKEKEETDEDTSELEEEVYTFSDDD